MKAIYAVWNKDSTKFGFLKEDFKRFVEFMEFAGVPRERLKIRYMELPKASPIANVMREEFKPREKQKPAVDFLSDKSKPNRVIDAATGFGKSFLGLNTAMQCEERAAFIMEPSHIKTWLKSIPEQTRLEHKKKVVVIQGRDTLKSLIDMAMMGIMEYDLIFFSAPTLREFYKDWENDEYDYPVEPDELFGLLGVGTIIRDEVHEAIHALVKQVIHMHVNRVIFLSATLVSDNSFINKIYDRVFPKHSRWKSEENRHICVRSVYYDMFDPRRKIKFNGFRGYSHVKYEQSIMKSAKLKNQYLSLLGRLVQASYISKYKEGMKCLVICSTKDMCKLVSDYLKSKLSDFTVGCYIHGAKDEELYDRQIVVSTPKGAGTGVDIPNLAISWLTVAISSTQLNRQIMGRLRPIKLYPDTDPVFFYLNNNRIPAHRKYDQKRQVDVMTRSKNFKKIDTGFILRAA